MIQSWETADSEARTRDNVRYYGSMGKDGLTDRIRALDGEWDAEQAVLAALSGMGLLGMVMGLIGSRLWRVLTWFSLPLILLADQGKWHPSQGLLKTLGLRSRKEIQEEKYALKALRGDFREVDSTPTPQEETLAGNSARALDAVKA